MSNGSCPVGAKNTADIASLHREQKEQNRRLECLESKINWLFTAVIATLLVGVANLIW